MRILFVIVVSIVVGGAAGLLAGAFADDQPAAPIGYETLP